MVSNTPIPPKLTDLLNDHTRGLLKNTFCSLPGKISSYDAATTTATIEIDMKILVNNKPQAFPLLVDVPVFQLTGALAGINMPIATGDPCLVIFADKDIDNWFATGSAQVPNSDRIHSLADGMALVGFRPLTNTVLPPDSTAASLYNDKAQVAIKGNKIAAKNASASLLTKLQQLMTDINTAIGSITTTGSDPQGGTVSGTVSGHTPVATDFTDLLYP